MDDYGDATIECTRCGATVYYELNICPECGLNFYQPEPDAWQATWTAETQETGLSVGGISIVGILLGILAAGFVMFVLQLLGNRLAAYPLAFNVLFLISGMAAGFVGGLLAGWLSNDRHLMVAAVVGFSTLILAVLFEAYWRDLSTTGLLNIRLVMTWGLVMIFALIGGMLARNRALRIDHILMANEADLYHDLMVKIGYDQALAERLIEYERQKSPAATRPILIQSAIRRWERDNRL